MEALKKTADPRQIFSEVLRSLESHREAKAEHDILDEIADRFGLPDDRKRWLDELVRGGVAVDEFLKFTLALIGPFVEMVLGIYAFLRDHVTTTGGRTEHFQINSDGIEKPWSFDLSKLPRQVEWIAAWMETRIEQVTIDWETISRCLNKDNGIFYATVEKVRLIQSLIIARRDRRLSPTMRAAADRIHEAMRRAARAWYYGALRELGDRAPERLLISAYVPSAAAELFANTGGRNGRLSIDLDVALSGEAEYSADDVFVQPIEKDDVMSLIPESQSRYAVSSAVFFCALWGLEEDSFRRIAQFLRVHEERRDLLFPPDLDARGPELAERVRDLIDHAITPTGLVDHGRELTRQRIEILLLPFWKDRWFLFEVWSLVQVLRVGQDAGAQLALEQVGAIPDPKIIGSVWSLPTQKAKHAVARLSSGDDALLVWFQRETKRRDSTKNMEPDIRLTNADPPFDDVAIVECKDRLKFGGAKADEVVDSYLAGSPASLVWLVNYEAERGARTRTGNRGAQACGVASGFRPHAVPTAFRETLGHIIREELDIETAAPPVLDLRFVIVDVSGSMSGKRLASTEVVKNTVNNDREHTRVWSSVVQDLDSADWPFDEQLTIRGGGAENGRALVEFARELPAEAKLTVFTDESGREHLLQNGAVEEFDPHDRQPRLSIGGRRLDIIVV